MGGEVALAAAPETTKTKNKALYLARGAVPKYTQWLQFSKSALRRCANDTPREGDEDLTDEKNRKSVLRKLEKAIKILRKNAKLHNEIAQLPLEDAKARLVQLGPTHPLVEHNPDDVLQRYYLQERIAKTSAERRRVLGRLLHYENFY